MGYGIKFDEIQLHQAGVPKYVKADIFYSHTENKLYPWRMLKLHGSLNWLKYLPISHHPMLFEERKILPEDKEREIILVNGNWWFNEPPYKDDWYIDPIMITPVLYKEKQFQDPLYKRVFDPIWDEARDKLSSCKKLIIIGYSFPQTDFPVKKLFLEAFSKNTPEILIVVNPDTSIISKIKDLCHYERPIVVCKNLKEFMQLNNPDDN